MKNVAWRDFPAGALAATRVIEAGYWQVLAVILAAPRAADNSREQSVGGGSGGGEDNPWRDEGGES